MLGVASVEGVPDEKHALMYAHAQCGRWAGSSAPLDRRPRGHAVLVRVGVLRLMSSVGSWLYLLYRCLCVSLCTVPGTKANTCLFGNAGRALRTKVAGSTTGAKVLSHLKGSVPLVPIKKLAVVGSQHQTCGRWLAHEGVPSCSCWCPVSRAYSCCTCRSSAHTRSCCVWVVMIKGRTSSERSATTGTFLSSPSSQSPTAVQLITASCRSIPTCSKPSATVQGG